MHRGPLLPSSVLLLCLSACQGSSLDGDRSKTERADAAAARAPAPGAEPYSVSDAPVPVIFYTVDTLRADHLGTYGYDRPTSPAIDAFAEDCVVFENFQALSSFTTTSMVSVMTGTHPGIHGAVDSPRGIPTDLPTLAEGMQAAGYETAGMTTIATVAADWGFDRGFEHFRYEPEGSRPQVYMRAHEVHALALDWLRDARDPERPFFLYLHLTDPHSPYVPRDDFREEWAPGLTWDTPASLVYLPHMSQYTEAEELERFRVDAVNLYDGGIADFDAQFGAFLDGLRAAGLYDESLIVLLSDHGEEFLDHDSWNHGHTLYREMLHVPLMIKFPGGWRAGTRARDFTDQTDVMPTVLAAVGAPLPEGPVGHDLVAVLEGRARRPVRSHPRLGLRGADRRAVIDGRWKLIENRKAAEGEDGIELFDRETDPFEKHDVSDAHPARVEALRALIREANLRADADLDPRTVASEDMDDRLRAIGYLD